MVVLKAGSRRYPISFAMATNSLLYHDIPFPVFFNASAAKCPPRRPLKKINTCIHMTLHTLQIRDLYFLIKKKRNTKAFSLSQKGVSHHTLLYASLVLQNVSTCNNQCTLDTQSPVQGCGQFSWYMCTVQIITRVKCISCENQKCMSYLS